MAYINVSNDYTATLSRSQIDCDSIMDFDHKAVLDDEDLVVGDKEEKNWRGIVISLLVIGAILSSIIFAIFLCTPNGDVESNKLKLDFEHVVSDAYKVQRFNGTWLSDHEIVFVDKFGSIVIYDADLNSTITLVKSNEKTLHTMENFKLSPDRQLILFESDIRRQFGKLVSAKYAIFNISAQTVEYVDDLFHAADPQKTPRVQFAMWGPKSNSLVFVESNDIYYVPDFSDQSGTASPSLVATATVALSGNGTNKHNSPAQPLPVQLVRLTKTGQLSDFIINGLPDGLYRNKIFGNSDSSSASDDDAGFSAREMATIWWSPDGRYLSFLSFDDAKVDAAPIAFYDTFLSDVSTSPKIHFERQPRAGAINPRVTVHVVDIHALNSPDSLVELITISPPSDLQAKYQADPRMSYYVTYVDWLAHPTKTDVDEEIAVAPVQHSKNVAQKNQLLVMWSERGQNSSTLTLCENAVEDDLESARQKSARLVTAKWKCETLASFSVQIPPSSNNAKSTILGSHSLSGQRMMFFALPRPDSVIGNHYHVAMLRAGDRSVKYLTHGEYDIDRLVSYDGVTDTLYFEVKVCSSAERHLYKITSLVNVALRQTKCLTCQLPTRCAYNYVHLNPGRVKYIVHECLGPQVPSSRMLRLVSTIIKSESRNLLLDANAGSQPPQHKVSMIHTTGGRLSAPSTNNNDKQQQSNQSPQQQQQQQAEYLEEVVELNRNEAIEQLVKSKQLPIEKFIAIKTNRDFPYDVHIKLYLPNEIEEEKDKKFPLVIESSEIDTRKVWLKFELNWGMYLASKKQLVYAKVDCIPNKNFASFSASTPSSPQHFLRLPVNQQPLTTQDKSSQVVQIQLQTDSTAAAAVAAGLSSSSSYSFGGAPDVDSFTNTDSMPVANAKDQAEVIKAIVENTELFPFVDKRRIAIWGPTSTASYMALATTIEDSAKLIGCTMAVAPITNWRYMDSYTAERYLGLPWLDANTYKYEQANLLKHSYEFATRKLLIVHGTADEQVHVQHSMQFIKSLSERHLLGGAMHQTQLYPDVGHSMSSVRNHFYLTLDGFLDRCFYQKPITIKATEWKGKGRPKLYPVR